MSRSGYTDDLDNWDMIKWRGRVASAMRGKRGQALLADLLKALDDMPEKVLIAHDLQDEHGDVCALGAVGKLRGVDVGELDPEEPEYIAAALNIATPMAQEIVYENDEHSFNETPEHRWQRMRDWVKSQIINKQELAAND